MRSIPAAKGEGIHFGSRFRSLTTTPRQATVYPQPVCYNPYSMRWERGRWASRVALAMMTCGAFVIAAALSAAVQKKKKDDETQVLQFPKDLPGAVEGDTRRLTFYTSPLSGKGLLSQQIRDAVKALEHRASGETILKIRAFVAGPGDVRRVRDLVSELFTDRKVALPALSLIRCGGLPLDGAQVLLEATAEGRKTTNPFGLAFISAQPAYSGDRQESVEPLIAKSADGLRRAVQAARATSSDVVRVTCFMSSLDSMTAARTLIEGEYPHAAVSYLQTQREPDRASVACEAVARLTADPGVPVRLVPSDPSTSDSGQSQIALVSPAAVVLTGTQVSFGFEPKDAHLAFERLQKELEQAGTSTRSVVFAHFYPLAIPIAAQIRQVRQEFFDRTRPPAGSMLLFEGLTSLDAGFAVDVIAVK